MRKFMCIVLALLLVWSVGVHPASASVGVQEDGVNKGGAITINFSQGFDVAGNSVKTVTVNSNVLADENVSNTTDTTIVTAAQTGRIFICKQATKFQLPAASAGLQYTFVSGSNVEIQIQVSTTPDTIVFAPPEIGNGNGVIETAGTNTTGNTVTLVSDGTNWYTLVPYSGTENWTDGGVWTALDRGAQ